MSEDSPAPNQRLHTRHRVLTEGKIVFSNLSAAIDVTIRDLSIGGARIRVPANIALPKLFNVLVVSERLLYPAELCWHRGEFAGIKFIGEARPTALKKQIVVSR